MKDKLQLFSKTRWRASAAEKRIHGGNTVTEFWVENLTTGKLLGTAIGYGATPGERRTNARRVWGNGYGTAL